MDNTPTRWQPRREPRRGRAVFGIVLAGVGVVLLLHAIFPQLHFTFFRFSWPWILVAIGMVIGIQSRFRSHAWWILTSIGAIYLIVPVYFPHIPTRRIVWPTILIGFGIALIFGRHDRRCRKHPHMNALTNDTDTVDINVTFSGRKEIVTSRAFRGGSIRASFAGVELNLTSAEAGPGPMELDVHASFAGVEIVVPSHWEVQNDISPTLGSVEDERVIRTTADNSAARPLLILRGSCTCSGVEVKSY